MTIDAAFDVEQHRAEIEAWRETRYERLRQPMSWLSLVALEWVDHGVNRLGSGPDVELRLPSGPPLAGRLVRDGRTVTAHAEGEAALTHDGRRVDGLELLSDADAPPGTGPTLLELGSLRMCVIRRGERIGLRAWDTVAPALRRFDGIPHYPVDRAWRLVGRFEPATAGATIAVPDVIGDVEEQELRGTVVLDVRDRTHRLAALDGADGQLWLVFADETNGNATYGGGRFVYTDAPGPDGSVVVDFNRAYNPPCVFTPYATCPLPPPGNRLPVRVEAGEKALSGPGHPTGP